VSKRERETFVNHRTVFTGTADYCGLSDCPLGIRQPG